MFRRFVYLGIKNFLMWIHHLVVCETCFQNLGRNRVSLEFLNCDTLLKSALCYYINDLIPEEIEITLSRQ